MATVKVGPHEVEVTYVSTADLAAAPFKATGAYLVDASGKKPTLKYDFEAGTVEEVDQVIVQIWPPPEEP